jgi:hypothetical protein
VLGLKVGASEAEPFWTEFLRSLNRRGRRGVKLVISDSHEGIKAATAKVLKATWQRCRVLFMRNALAHAGKAQRRMVSAAIGTVFVQDSADAARTQWRRVADDLRGRSLRRKSETWLEPPRFSHRNVTVQDCHRACPFSCETEDASRQGRSGKQLVCTELIETAMHAAIAIA